MYRKETDALSAQDICFTVPKVDTCSRAFRRKSMMYDDSREVERFSRSPESHTISNVR